MRRKLQAEEGQIVPLMAVLLALTGVCALALARLGAGVVDGAGAQAVADATALAAVSGGPSAAEEVAAANGAALVTWRTDGGIVSVVVRRRGRTAIAAAAAVAPEGE